MDWISCALPKPMMDEIMQIINSLGYPSASAFIQEAVRLHLEKKRWEFERKKAEEEERIVEKHEKGEPSIGFNK